uniref:Uncharacterized protein n=1 Tax=viral metagenome TaxID=1070528 RepID=A0A6M3LAM9_9ZZZZ
MVVPKLGNTNVHVCEQCKLRFYCFTNRDAENCMEEVGKLSDEEIKKIHIARAKEQGHHFPGEPAVAGE